MTRGWFVTGTDTGCGKTTVSAALLRGLASAGVRAAGLKPVASGADATPDGLQSADARALIAASPVRLPYAVVNPYCFAPPIAPHLAARQAGVVTEPAVIAQCVARARAQAEVLVIEGVGGWRVPLGPEWTTAELAVQLGLPVLLVVGIRLGCLNHALLTARDIRASGARWAGWIASRADPGCAEAGALVVELEARLGPALADLDLRDGAALDPPPGVVELVRRLQTQQGEGFPG